MKGFFRLAIVLFLLTTLTCAAAAVAVQSDSDMALDTLDWRERRDLAVEQGKLRDPDAVPLLAILLRDQDINVRWAAGNALANIGAAAVSVLQEALTDYQDDVRLRAVQALGAIGPDALEALPALELLSDDASVEVRRVLPGSLVKVGGAAAVSAITRMLSDPDDAVRREAVIALGDVGPEAKESVNALVVLLGDVFIVSSQVGKVLNAIVPDADLLAILLNALEAPDPDIRVKVIEAIRSRRYQDDKVVNALIKALHDGDPNVRRAAVKAVENMGSAAYAARDNLTVLLSDPTPEIRRAAAAAYQRIVPKDEWDYQLLLTLLWDPDLWVRNAAIRAADELSGEVNLIKILTEKLADEPIETKQLVAETLLKANITIEEMRSRGHDVVGTLNLEPQICSLGPVSIALEANYRSETGYQSKQRVLQEPITALDGQITLPFAFDVPSEAGQLELMMSIEGQACKSLTTNIAARPPIWVFPVRDNPDPAQMHMNIYPFHSGVLSVSVYDQSGELIRDLLQMEVKEGQEEQILVDLSDHQQLYSYSVRFALLTESGEEHRFTYQYKVNTVKHPVLDHDINLSVTALINRLSDLLSLSEAELLNVVPEQTPYIKVYHPETGEPINPNPTKTLDYVIFNPKRPFEVIDRNTNMAFPNDQYPMTHTAVFLNTLGEEIEVPYYQDSQGKKYFFQGLVHTAQRQWLESKIYLLAQLYHLTGDEQYARRTAIILDRLAQLYPHYLVKDGNWNSEIVEYVSTGGPWMVNGRQVGEKPSEPMASQQATSTPYGWTQSKWDRYWMAEVPTTFLYAYDLIYNSKALDVLSAEYGLDVRERIEEGLFRDAVEYTLTYPWWYHINNNVTNNIRNVVQVGKVIQDPDYVRVGYRWLQDVFTNYVFSHDGAFAESPGYFYVFQTGLYPVIEELKGYTDPPGYDGDDRMEDLDMEKVLQPMIDRAYAAAEAIRFPSGSLLPVHDNRSDDFTDPSYRPGNIKGQPLLASSSILLPGYGHAVLGDGKLDEQVQLHLHFSTDKDVNHSHQDSMSIMLYAFGREMLNDIGYNNTVYRRWAELTLSHNTVIVDRKNQNGPDSKGNVQFFAPNLPGIAAIQVDAPGAYDNVDLYRRTLVLNTIDLSHPYVVDIFEVQGGELHDYVLHGTTLHDISVVSSLELERMESDRPLLNPNETWHEPKRVRESITADGYGIFQNVSTAYAAEDFAVTFKYADPWQEPYINRSEWDERRLPKQGNYWFHQFDSSTYSERLDLGLKVHFLLSEQKHPQVFLGETPSLTRAGFRGSDPNSVLRPSLIVRYQPEAEQKSIFVVIHEPYYGAPAIDGVVLVEPELGGSDALVLKVNMGERTDLIMLSLDSSSTIQVTDAVCSGRLGVISQSQNGMVRGYLVGGSSLTWKGQELISQDGSYHGELIAALRIEDGDPADAFVTDVPLPEGDALGGSWMVVSFGSSGITNAYEIAKVERVKGQTLIYTTYDHGLSIEGGTSREIYFPRRVFSGDNQFVIYTEASVVR